MYITLTGAFPGKVETGFRPETRQIKTKEPCSDSFKIGMALAVKNRIHPYTSQEELGVMIRYFKGEPSAHIFHYRNGRAMRDGVGLQFWYVPMTSTIISVPITAQVAPFIFKEATANFQEVAIQGTVSYRIVEPRDMLARFDYSIDPVTGAYSSDEPEKLVQRIVNAVQAKTRVHVNAQSLETALQKVQLIADDVLQAATSETELADLGIVLETLHFTSVQPTPEMKKALEADYRERLQKQADQAIYARRAAAVEEERKIREREMDTDVELENRKKELVDMQARNQLALAEADAKAEEMRLTPYGDFAAPGFGGLGSERMGGECRQYR